MLRPGSAVRAVATSGCAVIRAAYPEIVEEDTPPPVAIKTITSEKPRTVLSGTDGSLILLIRSDPDPEQEPFI